MIWIWIGQFFSWLRWILAPPAPDFRPVRKIDKDAPCPICGHCKGRLSVGDNGGKPACQHTCLVCGGTFFEAPTVNDFLPALSAAQAVAAPTQHEAKPSSSK